MEERGRTNVRYDMFVERRAYHHKTLLPVGVNFVIGVTIVNRVPFD